MDHEENCTRITLPKINLLKAKIPLISVPLPEVFFLHLGKIALQWGEFENDVDNYIISMIKAASITTNDKWKFLPFKKRREKFLEEIRRCFSDIPILLSYLESIAEDSISLQKKRNALLHGRIELKIIVNFDPQLGMEEKLYIHATLYRKGVSEVFEFDLDEIEQLYYDIAHLHGRINEASDLNANIEGLPLEHKLSLTGFLKNNHPEYNDKL